MNRRGVNGRHGRRVLGLVVAASRHKRVNVEATFVGGTVQLSFNTIFTRQTLAIPFTIQTLIINRCGCAFLFLKKKKKKKKKNRFTKMSKVINYLISFSNEIRKIFIAFHVRDVLTSSLW